MHFKIVLILCLAFIFFDASAQEEQHTFEELLLEQLGEELGENVDISEVIERLNYYRKHPIDLNKSTPSDLANLVFLNTQQISNIIYHRDFTGPFINLLELQGIAGLDLNTIQLLLQFVKIGDSYSFKNLSFKEILNHDESMLMLRYGRNVEKSRGYNIVDTSRSRYLGDPNRYSLRYRWNYEDKLKFSLNAEKDAGEPFFQHKQKYGFDFYSAYLEFNHISENIKKVVIGDYSLQFGQGLVIWNGLSFGKGAWIGGVARQGMGLKGYSSMNESNFLRGISIQWKARHVQITPFVSFIPLTGNVEEIDGNKIISSINYSGLHRTPTELSQRNTITQFSYGTNITYEHNRLKLGITYLGINFNGKQISSGSLRELYDTEGSGIHQIGLHYQYNYRNYFLFGETANSIGGGFATNNGIIASLHPKLSVFTNYRNYAKNYHNFYGQSLSESSSISNEKGIYAGVVYQLTRKIEWTTYLDAFKFPRLKYRIDGPSEGIEFLSQFVYTWYKRGKLTLRYRYRLKQENHQLENKHENLLASVVRNQIRTDFQYKLNDSWSIRSRIEISRYDKEFSKESLGHLLYQDILWSNRNKKLALNMRASYFNTEGYDARIYAYESDVLYASSFPMYYDKGIRSYINARIRLSKNIDLWARYALTYYPEKEVIGSGLEEIISKKKSDVKLQLRWQW